MRDHLVFTLWAPLAAMGEIAVGERRTGFDRPAKSAVLGLLAAALGIERDAEATHLRIAEGYGLAIRVAVVGSILIDYHTAQVPPAKKGRRWATRRSELANAELGTVLSKREYRESPHFTLAVWANDSAPHALDHLANALRRPRFTLYFGRKACPLGLPPAPRIVAAENLADAFRHYDEMQSIDERRVIQHMGSQDRIGRIYAEVEEQDRLGPGLRANRIERRRDVPLSRRRWQFGLREELVVEPVASEPAS